MLTAEDRLQETYEVSAAAIISLKFVVVFTARSPLRGCVIEEGFESVTIGAVEKYITETAFENGWVKPANPVAERDESVGIIGAGPAGLAAADMLRRKGIK